MLKTNNNFLFAVGCYNIFFRDFVLRTAVYYLRKLVNCVQTNEIYIASSYHQKTFQVKAEGWYK